MFRIFNKYSDQILRVTFWNLHDGQSWLNNFPWRRVNHPLLFDRQGEPKPAYDAVLREMKRKRADFSSIAKTNPDGRVVAGIGLAADPAVHAGIFDAGGEWFV